MLCDKACDLFKNSGNFLDGANCGKIEDIQVAVILEKFSKYEYISGKIVFNNLIKTFLEKYNIVNYAVIPLVKCSEMNNSECKASAVKYCADKFLKDQLVTYKNLKYVVLSGSSSIRYFLKCSKVKTVRGRIHKIEYEGRELQFLPIYDPAIITYEPSAKIELQGDIQKLSEYLFNKKEKAIKNYITIENSIDGENKFLEYRQKALMTGISSVDIETSNPEATYEKAALNMFDPNSKIFSIAFSSQKDEAYFMLWDTVLKNKYIKKLVWDILENNSIQKWGQNFKFDMKFLFQKAGITVKNYAADSMLFHYLINEQHNTHNLDSLSWEYTDDGGYKDQTVESIKEVEKLTIEELKDRNCNDVDCVFQIVPKLQKEIEKQNLTYLSKYTIALERTLRDIELDGVQLDISLIKKTLEEINGKTSIVKRELIKFAESQGIEDINLNSSQQKAELVFNKLGFKPIYFTKKAKAPSVNKDYLLEMAADYNWAKYLLMYGTYNKIAVTYLKSWLDKVDSNGVLHSSFFIDGTETGRLSSRAPNLQNLPKAKEEDEVKADTHLYDMVKRCVISRFGDQGVIAEFDYSQLELRVIAMVTKDKKFCEACNSGIDLHLRTAQLMFNDDSITKEDHKRQIAKCIPVDTLLMTDTGIRRLNEFIIPEKSDTFIASKFRVWEGSRYIENIQTYNGGKKEIYSIHCRRGILRCSGEERIQLKDGRLVEAKKISKGDIIQDSDLNFVEQKNKVINFNLFCTNSRIDNTENAVKLFSIELTEEWAYFSGVFLGDGTMLSNKYCSIRSKNNEEWDLSVYSLLKNLGFCPKYAKNDKIYFGSAVAVRFLQDLGLGSKKGKELAVPTWAYANSKVAWSFLAGIIDTDGTGSNGNGISITTKSSKFASEICFLIKLLCGKESCYAEAMWNKKYLRYYFRIHLSRNACDALKATGKLRCIWKSKALDTRCSKNKIVNRKFKPNEVITILHEKEEDTADIFVDSEAHTYSLQGFIVHNCINFGLVYGMGVKKFARMLKIGEQEAQRMMDEYFKTFCEYDTWTKKEKSRLIQNRKSVSLLGRIRRLPNIISTDEFIQSRCIRQGINAQIQGLAGDITLHALQDINIDLRKRKLKSRVVLTVHDSILPDIYLPEKDEVIHLVKTSMEKKRWDWQIVPLVVDIKVGKNWADAEKLKYA